MTAGNNKSMLAARGRANGLKIAESAYHIGRQPTGGQHQAYSGYSGEITNHATTLSGQVIGSRFPQHYNQSTQNLFGGKGPLKANQSMVIQGGGGGSSGLPFMMQTQDNQPSINNSSTVYAHNF